MIGINPQRFFDDKIHIGFDPNDKKSGLICDLFEKVKSHIASIPKGNWLLQDTGFQGFELKDIFILQPKKKPRGKELTEEEKQLNQEISRVRIEHVMSGIKRCRIVKNRNRNWLRGFRDRAMLIACGLHNLRLKFRPWKIVEIPKSLKSV